MTEISWTSPKLLNISNDFAPKGEMAFQGKTKRIRDELEVPEPREMCLVGFRVFPMGSNGVQNDKKPEKTNIFIQIMFLDRF